MVRAALDGLVDGLLYSRSLIETAASIGQGTGVLGDTKKMSVNSTSSTYQAIDDLRPASAFTLDFHGTVSRLNNFLNTGASNGGMASDAFGAGWPKGTRSHDPAVGRHVSPSAETSIR